MKSLQAKMILTLVICMCVSMATIVAFDFFNLNQVMLENSTLSMKMSLNSLTDDVNRQVYGVEQSTRTMYEYAMQAFKEDPAILKSQNGIDDFLEAFRSHVDYDATNTYGAITSYFALNPKVYGTQRGFFLTRDSLDSPMATETMTDILAYSETDLEHVGWYYIPIKQGEAMWMSPYLNENIDRWMTSYVIPMYDGKGEAIGITGMDLDFELVSSLVSDAYVFSDNGSAALFDSSGNLLYQADYNIQLGDDPSVLKRGFGNRSDEETRDIDGLWKAANASMESGEAAACTLKGIPYRIVAERLENGMTLIAMVPESDIMAPIWNHILTSGAIAIAIMIVSIIIASFVTRGVTRPLRDLASASHQISEGNLEVEINVTSKDEVGQLAQTFKQMTADLRARMHEMRQQAYIDPLTGIGNRAAYERATDALKARMGKENVSFTLVVLDLNGLKTVNDTDGHEAGDMFIRDAARAISSVFGEGRSYRFGGDEFAAILEDADLNTNEQWSKMIHEAISQVNVQRAFDEEDDRPYSKPLSIAWGIATYDSGKHATYDDVFNEADQQMYDHKLDCRTS